MVKLKNIILFLVVFCALAVRGYADVEEVFYWSRVNYENLPQQENSYVGPYPYYVPENNEVLNIGYHPASGLVTTTVGRFRPGVPIALGAFCIGDYRTGSSPRIWGFPSYEANALIPEDFAGGSYEENQRKNLKNLPEDDNQDLNLNSTEFEDDEGRRGHKKHKKKGQVQYVPIEVPTKIPHQPPAKVPPPSHATTRIISTFYTTIDEKCNRVFLADHGVLTYYGNSTYFIQKPALVVIDLPTYGCKTRNFPFIRRAELPDSIIAKGGDGLMAVTLDYQSKDSCDDLFVYMPNSFHSYLVVYDYRNDKYWMFEHETFLPVIAESQFVFGGTFPYALQMGIYSVQLGLPDKYGNRIAYYTPFAGTAQYAVSTEILKNQRNSPENFHQDDFRIVGYRGEGHQSMKTVIDYTHEVMFYAEIQSHQIRCWNINKPLNPDNIDVVYESNQLNFTSYVGVDSRGYLWFDTNHIPIDYLTNIPLDLQEVNSMSFRVKVSDAIKGTVCEN
ncbi:L-dopachrome tautomerase yellow-f-like [Lutzomyia longipalpis]|uniref:L-dopachrome tautomerase yellow-f-like n=1 Tax=Lutzomyia longipalpis TaxID=7200 RepID=UPI0024843E87|nr:L-dopachrome tautomerase yellow-f-like [Lutzomyia longipalpis]